MQFHNGYLQVHDLYIVPVCHYRLEFAEIARHAFQEIQPDCAAVELPSTLQEHIIKAVERFPCLSALFYKNKKEDMIYFPVEPADPFYETIRSGLEARIPVHLVDLDMDEYPHIFDPMPDSYAVFRLGPRPCWEEYSRIHHKREARVHSPEDELRETHMAYHLKKLMEPGKKLLFVCGMAHVEGVLKKLESPALAQPLGKVVRSHITVYNLHPDSIREVTGEMPFLLSIFEMERGGYQLPDPKEGAKVIPFASRTGAAPAEKQAAETVALSTIPVKRFIVNQYEKEKEKLEKTIFSQLLKALGRKLSFMPDDPEKLHHPPVDREVPDFRNLSGVRRLAIERENIFRFKTSEDRRVELLSFYRELQQDKKILPHSPGRSLWDRQQLLVRMVRKAALYYQENTGEEIKGWQVRTMMKYARNYAMVTGMLIADAYQLIMAARGVADDNFAYEIWDLLSYYPWQDKSGTFPTIFIRADEVWLGGKKFTLRRRFPRLRERLTRVPVKERKKERLPGEWTDNFNDLHMCSYPPEDIIIENYGDYLKKKAVTMLSEERARVEPFTYSLLDGIDMRETVRNWHYEKKIYVREHQKIGGGAGSVVVIYDEDPEDRRFPWKMTWLGEHSQESDMAFYATPMEAKIVGPGIARCEYGGLMLTYPPMRLYDVWTDPLYAQARTKSEVLLMAAIEYSVERHVVYVSAHPPRSWFGTFASRLNRKIVYIPIGQLSPASLKKLRVFHVLNGKQVRDYAKDFVW